jgi:hypothetical protein
VEKEQETNVQLAIGGIVFALQCRPAVEVISGVRRRLHAAVFVT